MDQKAVKRKRKADAAPLDDSAQVSKSKEQVLESEPKTTTTPLLLQTKGVKRKRRRADDSAEASEAERERRQRQRDLRELALGLRAVGKSYTKPRIKKQKIEAATHKRDSKTKNDSFLADETGSRPDGPVQVIVVPIFWNKRAEEKADVIQAAEDVLKLLQGGGFSAGIDTTITLPPGQKFSYWEHLGVKLRIELGPKDVKSSSCVLARSTSPGKLADKQNIQVGYALLKKIGEELGQEPLGNKNENKQDIYKFPEVMEVDKEDVMGLKYAGVPSGDDLGGDFGDLAFGDEQPRKKRRKK